MTPAGIDPRWFFERVWSRLCRRFGRAIDHDEAGDYLAYLERAGMTQEDVAAAAEVAWASREFFPRPADFLAPEADLGWLALRAYIAIRATGDEEADMARYRAARARIPERAMQALDAIGGLAALRETPPERVPLLRRDFNDSFARVLNAQEYARALPPEPEPARTLPSPVVHAIESGERVRINVAALRSMSTP